MSDMTVRYYTPDEMPSPRYDDGGDRRFILRTEIGDASVSTVFLSLDHNWDPAGPPLIYETMVFGGPLDQEQWRYSTKAEATKGHAAVCEQVRNATKDD
jgi:hypothetical protein